MPLNQAVLPSSRVDHCLDFNCNNLGDPFRPGVYGVNTFDAEREVIDRAAELFNAPKKHWGYVTNSGSEGNAVGVFAGLTRYPNAVVYSSDAVHYSVDKACRYARAPHVKLPSRKGKLSLAAFAEAMHNRKYPAVVVLTAGTVLEGAADDVMGAREAYIHVDAALFGMLTPWLAMPTPVYDFRRPIDSLSFSGHKMLGTPLTCGVFLARERPAAPYIEYVDSVDSTFGGSRAGILPLLLKLAFEGEADFPATCAECIRVAAYAEERVPGAWRSGPWSNVVVLPKPPEKVVRKWQLAVKGELSHTVCMPHVSTRLIDDFAQDLKEAQLCVT
jgi:histidine decarboxylase